MNSTLVTWEAVYDDSTVVRERDGFLYANLDRNRLVELRLVTPGEIFAAVLAGDGRNGWNLVYRRRTIMTAGQTKQVWFMLGFMPMGPFVAVQPETEQVLRANELHHGAGPLGMVEPIPAERWGNLSHGTIVSVRPQQITLPSGYVLGGT
jgi:hypothetical protein